MPPMLRRAAFRKEADPSTFPSPDLVDFWERRARICPQLGEEEENLARRIYEDTQVQGRVNSPRTFSTAASSVSPLRSRCATRPSFLSSLTLATRAARFASSSAAL